MEKQQKKGLLALLGIGAGVFAWWKYKNMTPDKKEELHAQMNEAGQRVKESVNEAGKKMKDAANDVETAVKEKYDQLKKGADKKVDEVNQKV